MIKHFRPLASTQEGSFSIFALIIGMVIIVGTAAMLGYMVKDIDFTELDESKLKALNLAEAGLASMYDNLERYYSDDITNLPGSPYSMQFEESGTDLGSYEVTYYYFDDGEDTGYKISSKGVDVSGITRTLEVIVTLQEGGSFFNIFDYVYSQDAVSITGSKEVTVTGPFYINSNFRYTGSTSLYMGPSIINGDMTVTGSSTRVGFPIFVNGDMRVTGSAEIYPEGEQDLLAVFGDIRRTGSAVLGTQENPVELYCTGDISETGSGHIYYYLSPDTYTFDYPGFDVNSYVESVLAGTSVEALVINHDLDIEEDNYFDYSDGINSLYFHEDDGEFILEIEGNVYIDGEVNIGENLNWNKQYTIRYSGKGIMMSPEDINVYCRFKPIIRDDYLNYSNFPSEDMVVLVSDGDIDLSLREAEKYADSDCDDADVYAICIVSGVVDFVKKNTTLKGTAIAGEIDLGTGSGFATICYEESLTGSAPEGLDGSFGSGGDYSLEIQNWQEVQGE